MLKITALQSKHLKSVVSILAPIVSDKALKQKLKLHIEKGIAKIGIDDATGHIEAIGCFVVGQDKRCSLSYYWLAPKYRGKLESLLFYTHVFTLIPQGFEVYIHARNIETFKRYVEPVGLKNEYRWIGLRSLEHMKTKAKEWAALQKQSEK